MMGCGEVQSQGARVLTEVMGGYTASVCRSERRLFIIITGALCLAVGIGFAMVWEEAAVRYHLHRLRTEPDYLRMVVIDRLEREEPSSSWHGMIRAEPGYLVEFVESFDRHPKSSLPWVAMRELMESPEGRQASVGALQDAGFQAALDKLRRR